MTDRAKRQSELEQQRRMVWLLILFSMLGFLLIGRLAWFQLIARPRGLQQIPESIPAARGSILDSSGHYVVVSTYACNVFFRPDRYDDALARETFQRRLTQTVAAIAAGQEVTTRHGRALAPLLLDAQTGAPRPLVSDLQGPLLVEQNLHRALVILLSDILDEPSSTVDRVLQGPRGRRHTLRTGVPEPVCRAIEGLAGTDRPILVVETSFQRIYPDGHLMAHVLGFINFQDEPHFGVEAYYARLLRGQRGEWRGINNPHGYRLMAVLGGYVPARDGTDLVLTIDRVIQYEAERILREAIVASDAGSGTLIVLDPRTGAVRAMANMPTYEPALFFEAQPETWRNSAISVIYEPGSVIKTLTVAAALDAQVIHPNTTYEDLGVILVGGQEVRNADLQAHGVRTMTEMLAYSLNVGSAHVASALGPARFYEMFKRFGFSDPTGIDLIGEERGIMRVPGQAAWHMSDLGRNSFGQGMSATALQVAMAYGALANDGVLQRPFVVEAVSDQNGVRPMIRDVGRQVVSPEVADQVTDMLIEAVKLGMQPALVPGYTVAGKSGTSQVVVGGEYQEGNYIGSFVGYGPATDPRFVILVKLNGLADGQGGSSEAGPAFAEMFKFLMNYYRIPPDA